MQAPSHQTVYVLATMPTGTTRALHEAHSRAQSDGARIALLVPHLTSGIARTQDGAADPVERMSQFDALASQAGIPVKSYVCICKRPRDLAAWFDLERSTIVVGGRRRRWGIPTPERRLARALARLQHEVVFVDADL